MSVLNWLGVINIAITVVGAGITAYGAAHLAGSTTTQSLVAAGAAGFWALINHFRTPPAVTKPAPPGGGA